jgi:hypothetical protein
MSQESFRTDLQQTVYKHVSLVLAILQTLWVIEIKRDVLFRYARDVVGVFLFVLRNLAKILYVIEICGLMILVAIPIRNQGPFWRLWHKILSSVDLVDDSGDPQHVEGGKELVRARAKCQGVLQHGHPASWLTVP